MSEHSFCTDNTGTSPILSRVLHSERVMSSPGTAVVDPAEFELAGTQTPSSCFVDADDIIPTSTPPLISRCASLTPGKAVQSKTSNTSPGSCMIGSRTSSQKKLLASGLGPLLPRQSHRLNKATEAGAYLEKTILPSPSKHPYPQ